QASRSTSNGSAPMTYRGASSRMQATSVSVLLTIRTSLRPTMPDSVTSSRNVSSRHGVPTTVIRASATGEDIFKAASMVAHGGNGVARDIRLLSRLFGARFATQAVARPIHRRNAMFSLTVIDHVRLDCEHVARNYTMHARAADRFASLAFIVRMVMAVLLAAAAAACVSSALLPARFYQLAAVATTTTALIGFALYSVLGLESRVSAHRTFAHRLWIVTARYRSLIPEAKDGIVDLGVLLRRRDELIEQVHAIYERGFAVDQPAYEAARLPHYEPASSNAA